MPLVIPAIDRSQDSLADFSPAYRAVVTSLPAFLQPFCVDQHYHEYTAEDHCVWRYVMRQHMVWMAQHAHPVYRSGLQAAAISSAAIPRIEAMNQALGQLGWRAVCVDGFVPPAIFMEFQAHRVLPISADMRTLTHIVYTPAPDIIHEAAGHAPIVADPRYGEFLARVGAVGARALPSQADEQVYEAVRALSISKEHPNSSAEDISQAEQALQQALEAQAIDQPSEATQMARFHWWTVEYGLVGNLEQPTIHGAGLLSSLEESRHCLGPKVQKRPLSLACVDQPYDITTMQPQLFVARDWDHLFAVLAELEATFAQTTGGTAGVQMAIRCATLASAELSSGLQVTGMFNHCEHDANGNLTMFRTTGPTSLALAGQELPGHGAAACPQGLVVPLGPVLGLPETLQGALERVDPCSLAAAGWHQGQVCQLAYASGITVTGTLASARYQDDTLVLLRFTDARVTATNGSPLLPAGQTSFDLAVGQDVRSVFAGPADRNNYNFPPPASSLRNLPVSYTTTQLVAEQLYQELVDLRRHGRSTPEQLVSIYQRLGPLVGDKWLMLLDILELAQQHPDSCADLIHQLRAELARRRRERPHQQPLIDRGLALVDTPPATV